MLEKGVIEGEQDNVGEPPFMVFMRMGGKDPVDFRDALVTKLGKNGRTAIQEVRAVINGNHITAALAH